MQAELTIDPGCSIPTAGTNNIKVDVTSHVQPNFITFDDFKKIEIKTGTVISAESVDGSDKLLLLKISIPHQIIVFAGIKKHIAPEILVNKKVLVVTNLQPRKMGKFGTSEGMLLSTIDGENVQPVFLEDNLKDGPLKDGLEVG